MRLSGGKNPVIITNSINKTVLSPFCDNKCDCNKQKSVINCFTKIWQYVVSLILTKTKTPNSLDKYFIIWVSKFNVCIK